VSWQPMHLYDKMIASGAKIMEGHTYELLKLSEAAVVTSGTATLETALIGTPQVVVYKANWLSVIIARWLVKIKYISLVNLVMDKPVVTELIQGEVTEKSIQSELNAIIEGGKKRTSILDDYKKLRQKLGEKGASEIVAKRLLKIINP
jgi:lipid-A-disaccharide synthase